MNSSVGLITVCKVGYECADVLLGHDFYVTIGFKRLLNEMIASVLSCKANPMEYLHHRVGFVDTTRDCVDACNEDIRKRCWGKWCCHI